MRIWADKKGVLGYGIGVGKGEVDMVLAVMRLKVCRNLFLLKVSGIT